MCRDDSGHITVFATSTANNSTASHHPKPHGAPVYNAAFFAFEIGFLSVALAVLELAIEQAIGHVTGTSYGCLLYILDENNVSGDFS